MLKSCGIPLLTVYGGTGREHIRAPLEWTLSLVQMVTQSLYYSSKIYYFGFVSFLWLNLKVDTQTQCLLYQTKHLYFEMNEGLFPPQLFCEMWVEDVLYATFLHFIKAL